MMEKLALTKPFIQAPMAGVTSPKFVAACCEAGIIGAIGAGYLSGKETKDFIQQVKARTKQPFCVNLFVPEVPKLDTNVIETARAMLQPFYEELDVSGTVPALSTQVFDDQIEAVIEEGVEICSFTFGIPDATTITKLKAKGLYLIGTATTIEEAIAVEKAGLDAVVLQGSEAGGHRGTFTEPLQLLPTVQLLKNATPHITIPVIAAGGIMTKCNVEEMLKLGAVAVQIGTALLTAHECEVSQVHKKAILESKPNETTLTKAFTGKYARGLKNEFTEKLKDAVVAPYPIQHYLTLGIRRESAKQNKPHYLSLWMGENSYLAKEASVQEIIAKLTPLNMN